MIRQYGLKSVAKGVVTGAVGLVASPIAGAKDAGVQGFFMGLASGIFSAVALPVAGAAVGAYQLGRGAINSVESSIESANGAQVRKGLQIEGCGCGCD